MKIKGRITSFGSGSPIPDIKIGLWIGENNISNIKSFNDGMFDHYIEPHLAGGTLVYKVEHKGYRPVKGSRLIGNEDIDLGDISLIADEILINGLITSEGRPLEGAKVTARLDGRSLPQVLSDRQGQFRVQVQSTDYMGKKVTCHISKFWHKSYDTSPRLIEECAITLEAIDLSPIRWWNIFVEYLKKFWKLIFALIALTAVLVSLKYCADKPRIVTFEADSDEIAVGKTVTLHWRTDKASEVEISSIGQVHRDGERSISPKSTTTYTLRARGEHGEVTRDLTINVYEGPKIHYTVSPESPLPNQPATISWEATHATEMAFDNEQVELKGSRTVRSQKTAHYTLSAKNSKGDQDIRRVTLTIGSPPASGPTLTGTWRANDGGTYYVRQIGNSIWWAGFSGDDGKSFTNVFRGKLSGSTIVGDWADLPRGTALSDGRLILEVNVTSGGEFHLQRKKGTGGFGGSAWTRVATKPSMPLSRYIPAKGNVIDQVTGHWEGQDKALYHIRQVGQTIWWVGISQDEGNAFTNVFHGTATNNMAAGEWVDVPRGTILHQGTLKLKVTNSAPMNGMAIWNEVERQSQTGGFGAKKLTRIGYVNQNKH